MIRILIFILYSISVSSYLGAQVNTTIPVGVVTDSIKCASNTRFSYALYLPHAYSKDIQWPVIFIFDPAGRGVVGLKNFVQAAEKYKYILACSNDSRNNISWNEVLSASVTMIDDVKKNLSIDKNRIYTSGFSGGSRVASYTALNIAGISGVIGCGAGFPADAEITKSPSFDYYGIVGYRDFNYYEMSDLERKLLAYAMVVKFQTIDTGHVRPSVTEILKAVEWIELQAMKKGYIPEDTVFIKNQFNRQFIYAEQFRRNGELLEAVRNYKYIVCDFKDEEDIQKVYSLIDSLENLKDFRKDSLEWLKLKSDEMKIQGNFINSLQSLNYRVSIPDSVKNWWRNEVRVLYNSEKSSNKHKQYMASRILAYLSLLCYDKGNNYMNLKQYQYACVIYQLLTYIRPESQWTYFYFAKALSFNNKTSESLNALEKAVKYGLNDSELINDEPAFVNLKDKKRFRSIMAKMNDSKSDIGQEEN